MTSFSLWVRRGWSSLSTFGRLSAAAVTLSPARAAHLVYLSKFTAAFTYWAALMDGVHGYHAVAVLEFTLASFLLVAVQTRRKLGDLRANGHIAALCVVTIYLGHVLLQLQEVRLILWVPLFPLLVLFLSGLRAGVAWVLVWLLAMAGRESLFLLGKLSTGLPLSLFLEVLLATAAVTTIAASYERGYRRYELKTYISSKLDPLTRIFNRSAFHEILRDEIGPASKPSRPLSLFLFDIDYFKQVNDRYGHAMDDEVLQEFTHVIQMHKGDDDIFARLGGEEFALLTNLSGAEAVQEAERLREQIATHSFYEVGRVTCSIGVAEWTSGSERALLARADKALYLAKAAGRNRAQLAPKEENDSANRVELVRKWRDLPR